MSAGEWFAIGVVCFVGALGFALTLLSINQRTEGDDAEERREVGKAADAWEAEKLRQEGLL